MNDFARGFSTSVVWNMPVGLHLWRLEDPADDRSLRFVGGNQAAERILGRTSEQLLGRTLDEAYPSVRALGVPQALAEVARGGAPWRMEQFVDDAERGTTTGYAVQAFALGDLCVGVIFENATERLRAEEDLRRSEARQRALVDAIPDTLYRVGSDGSARDVRSGAAGPDTLAARTAPHLLAPPGPGEVRIFEYQHGDLDFEARLVRTADGESLAIVRDITERKQGDRRKDEFISIVSHELRTPLTSIRGALGLIEGGVVGDAPPVLAELVTVARENADRLIRLVNDMLDLDKMEAGRLDLELVTLDAREIVDAALTGVRAAAALAGVHLFGFAEERLDPVLGDRDRVLQVLTNLLSNAIRFSPPQARVTVTVRPASPGRVRFVVRDEGPGVPPDRVGHLFRKFSQIGGADARRRGGTGLGLAISKAIVEQHGGAIGLLPDGPGASFWFELPTTAPSVTDALADLRAAYAASLPAQVGTLAALAERAREDDGPLADALALAHRIKGTAGTYGLLAVSDAAARLEQILGDRSRRRTDTPGALAALFAALPGR